MLRYLSGLAAGLLRRLRFAHDRAADRVLVAALEHVSGIVFELKISHPFVIGLDAADVMDVAPGARRPPEEASDLASAALDDEPGAVAGTAMVRVAVERVEQALEGLSSLLVTRSRLARELAV